MLNKVRVGMIVGAILMGLQAFLPDIPVPDGLEDALVLVIVFVAQFFTRETPQTIERLALKR